MMRVTQVSQGPDGVIRSISMKFADGVPRRPIVKLVLVFFECFKEKTGPAVLTQKDMENNDN